MPRVGIGSSRRWHALAAQALIYHKPYVLITTLELINEMRTLVLTLSYGMVLIGHSHRRLNTRKTEEFVSDVEAREAYTIVPH
jgi:hypothetical protein